MDGQRHPRDFAHNCHAPLKTVVFKELFPSGPLKTHSSSWNTEDENPNGPLKRRSLSRNTRYDNAAKWRRIWSHPGDTNQKWLRGQSPPPLYHAKNETPALINDRNREAKYIDEGDQINARHYSHSHHSGTVFDGTEENKRPIHHYSPTKSSNRTELATAGRQLVSYGPRTSPPLPRKYYHSGRINDKANASAPLFNVPNIFTNDKSTGLVASRGLEAQNIQSRAIAKDKSTALAAHRGAQP